MTPTHASNMLWVPQRAHPMSEFQYTAPAELFAAQGRSGLRYRRFSRAADAIRYAVEKLPSDVLSSARLKVEQKCYDAQQIRALYDSAVFPEAVTSGTEGALHGRGHPAELPRSL